MTHYFSTGPNIDILTMMRTEEVNCSTDMEVKNCSNIRPILRLKAFTEERHLF